MIEPARHSFCEQAFYECLEQTIVCLAFSRLRLGPLASIDDLHGTKDPGWYRLQMIHILHLEPVSVFGLQSRLIVRRLTRQFIDRSVVYANL